MGQIKNSTDLYTLGVYILLWYIYDMIQIRLSELLESRGRSLYWLAKESGIRYATVWKLGKGRSTRLRLDVLDNICAVLDCQPGDLLVRVEQNKRRKGVR